MTSNELIQILSVITPDVYEIEAPAGVTRYIAWHAYNVRRIFGDDRTAARFDRVQLDVYWPPVEDTLWDDTLAVLDYWRVPYDIQDLTYDDDRKLRRGIIQLTAV